MTSSWVDLLSVVGVQHIWQSAMLLFITWLGFKLRRLRADACSWL